MIDKIKGTLRVSLKVADGRLIIHSVQTFVKGVENVSRKSINQLRICPHLEWAPDHLCDECLTSWSLVGQFLRDRSRAQIYTDPNRALELASVLAFRNGRETCGSCVFCETDFTVQAFSEGTIVRVWQNLGSETTYLNNSSWQWQTDFRYNDVVYSRPGRIRQLYDHEAI
ncbi:uncharacterized protein TRIVIDRAFT_36644 [Trichoderma virens Gv29-8]|uniref:Uncharacterized protein n=1 Tax=Hypocrea virens (strain Gv29-8 / FGSC 10586) TaxID=413071 RepID=G9MNI1_HYPVG|nr:uncharacterized protein TRIVIDRAFT_36644 [Trichoderma virens Gv29-8]EHK23437.1 hypothetical protein TRIVIDRAFT_36644 [Trichoderma virens Gv29-8]